jgi:hypothetical protein
MNQSLPRALNIAAYLIEARSIVSQTISTIDYGEGELILYVKHNKGGD